MSTASDSGRASREAAQLAPDDIQELEKRHREEMDQLKQRFQYTSRKQKDVFLQQKAALQQTWNQVEMYKQKYTDLEKKYHDRIQNPLQERSNALSEPLPLTSNIDDEIIAKMVVYIENLERNTFVGTTLTAQPVDCGDALQFQWSRSFYGSNFQPIEGAITTNYIPSVDDVGASLRISVTNVDLNHTVTAETSPCILDEKLVESLGRFLSSKKPHDFDVSLLGESTSKKHCLQVNKEKVKIRLGKKTIEKGAYTGSVSVTLANPAENRISLQLSKGGARHTLETASSSDTCLILCLIRCHNYKAHVHVFDVRIIDGVYYTSILAQMNLRRLQAKISKKSPSSPSRSESVSQDSEEASQHNNEIEYDADGFIIVKEDRQKAFIDPVPDDWTDDEEHSPNVVSLNPVVIKPRQEQSPAALDLKSYGLNFEAPPAAIGKRTQRTQQKSQKVKQSAKKGNHRSSKHPHVDAVPVRLHANEFLRYEQMMSGKVNDVKAYGEVAIALLESKDVHDIKMSLNDPNDVVTKVVANGSAAVHHNDGSLSALLSSNSETPVLKYMFDPDTSELPLSLIQVWNRSDDELSIRVLMELLDEKSPVSNIQIRFAFRGSSVSLLSSTPQLQYDGDSKKASWNPTMEGRTLELRATWKVSEDVKPSFLVLSYVQPNSLLSHVDFDFHSTAVVGEIVHSLVVSRAVCKN